jgi:hypothetical protein
VQSFQKQSIACIDGIATTICCIYLADVPDQPDLYYTEVVRSKYIQTLKQTRWLTRGWTLQESLASRDRDFYSMNWECFVETEVILEAISEETGIPIVAITDFKPERWSVAQRMSRAARRRTTRMEDRAYSLLGLFNVNMPLIYGEGDSAFRRLREEILKNSTDQTIFCWTAPGSSFSTWRGLLARSPSEFANSGYFLENKRLKAVPFQLTNKGIQMSLRLEPASLAPGVFIALLQCYHAKSRGQCGIYIQRTHDDNYIRVVPHLMAEIPSSMVRKQATSFEMLFAKPELAGITWRKSDMCSRIAGFRFPDTTNALPDDCNEWINEIVLNGQYSWDDRIFSFGVDPGEKAPKSAVARCHLDSDSDCRIEIWVKYDWRKKYGEDGEGNVDTSGTRGTTDSDWVQSECCEWKIQGKSCSEFQLSLSSWIELDDKSDAYIHVEFFDSGNHDDCDGEEGEDDFSQISGQVGFQLFGT